MIDLRITARGLTFRCAGLRDCCAESENARCPCPRRLADHVSAAGAARQGAGEDAQSGARAPQPAGGAPTPGARHGPPAPTLGDVFAAAIRRRCQ